MSQEDIKEELKGKVKEFLKEYLGIAKKYLAEIREIGEKLQNTAENAKELGFDEEEFANLFYLAIVEMDVSDDDIDLIRTFFNLGGRMTEDELETIQKAMKDRTEQNAQNKRGGNLL